MSQTRYALRPAASRELHRLALYFQIEAGPEIAVRFVRMARKSFDALAENPGLGSPVISNDTSLAGLRKGRAAGFPKVLIFYLTRGDRILVVRILHSASNWQVTLKTDKLQRK